MFYVLALLFGDLASRRWLGVSASCMHTAATTPDGVVRFKSLPLIIGRHWLLTLKERMEGVAAKLPIPLHRATL